MPRQETHITPIPTQWIGPLTISGNAVNDTVRVPLATYETPLWPSTARGAKVAEHCGGVRCTLIDDRMARSILLEAPDAATAYTALQQILAARDELAAVVAGTGRFARLLDLHHQIVGNLLYLRLECATGDASGHNMVTKAADAVLSHILAAHPELAYGSISANYCTDKKASAVNGILGRGKNIIAEITIPRRLCERMLRTTPEKICALNLRKNHIGGELAGSIRSANAHFANILLAFYLATGQDAANIIEGSQGIVHTETRGDDLYFSCTLPNLIIGSVGNGKGGGNDAVEAHLHALGCREDRPAGENARRLAAICAATVLCGELSLLAAQTNPGELMRAHLALERRA